MVYNTYTIGGELYHYAKGSEKAGAKYLEKVRTKSGKWRYVYDNKKKTSGRKKHVTEGKGGVVVGEVVTDEKVGTGDGAANALGPKKKDLKSKVQEKSRETRKIMDKARSKVEEKAQKTRDTLSEIIDKLEKKTHKKNKK